MAHELHSRRGDIQLARIVPFSYRALYRAHVVLKRLTFPLRHRTSQLPHEGTHSGKDPTASHCGRGSSPRRLEGEEICIAPAVAT